MFITPLSKTVNYMYMYLVVKWYCLFVCLFLAQKTCQCRGEQSADRAVQSAVEARWEGRDRNHISLQGTGKLH